MSAWPEGEFVLPLFPLPNLVFFPETRLPLHVFEPRYRQLVSDVVSADKRFGIVLLRPGWEADYFGTPATHLTGTVGEIEHIASLDDGKYNILVRGQVRFRIVGEVHKEPYRTARVVAQPQAERSANDAYAQRTWLAELARQYLKHLPEQDGVPEIETVGLEALTNALIMSLNLDTEEKQRLLENDDLISRAETIGNDLQTRIESLRFLAPYRKGGGDPSRN
jgi:Lon protease-like protein